jgi:acetyl esterase
MSARQPIDPALRRLLDGQAAALAQFGSFAALTDAERVQLRRALSLRALQSRATIAGLPNAVQMRDLTVSGSLTARWYRPPGDAVLPVLVYLHGGGWVTGSIATHEPFCRLLSAASGVMILSIEYRLAPEHRYPAALEDALEAARWTAEHAGDWGGDVGRLALGGDSSGANLAAVAANRICSSGGGAPLRGLLLLYPVTDHPSHLHESWRQNASGYGLEAPVMQWYWDQYAPGVAADDADASPLRITDVPALPPTLITTAEYDVLRDEGIAYADRLQSAGVAVTRLHAPDMHHNFPVNPATVARFHQCDRALGQIAAWLTRTLRGTEARAPR